MSEIALVSVRKSKLEQMANKGNENAKTALKLLENPEVFLGTAQIGITLISIVTGFYSGEKFGKYLEPVIAQIGFLEKYASSISTAIIVILVTFFSIIIGELVPKRIGLLRAENLAVAVAKPMLWLSKAVHPFVWFLNAITKLIFTLFNVKVGKDSAITEEEIKAMVSESAESGEIDEAEQEIIERVFHLGDRSITSLMTHRSDIAWLDVNDTISALEKEVKTIPHSVYPLCEGDIDDIKGILQLKDIVFEDKNTPLKNFLKPALFVPVNNTAYQVMERFKQTKVHSCFIVDEYGTLQGMITLNDILEAIVGDIPEAGDDDYEIVKRKDGSYLVDAQLPFYDFLSEFDKGEWHNDEQDYDTIGGFIIHYLERIPVVTDTFEWRGFNFEIMDMDGARIDKVLVTLSQERQDEVEEDS